MEDEPQSRLAKLKTLAEDKLPQLKGSPFVALSSHSGRGVERLMTDRLGSEWVPDCRALLSPLVRLERFFATQLRAREGCGAEPAGEPAEAGSGAVEHEVDAADGDPEGGGDHPGALLAGWWGTGVGMRLHGFGTCFGWHGHHRAG